jgi:hypothetical protein
MTPRRRFHDEGGFTMLVVLGVLTVCAALTAVAFGSVVNDIPLRKDSRDKKAAYAAAEAGVNFYVSRMNQDNEYWAKCAGVPAPNATEPSPVNQRWDGAGADPRQFRVVPGSSARYTVELLPAVGTDCLASDPAGTMLDANTGTIRLRATGFAGCASAATPLQSCNEKRSIIFTMRRKSFLDYLYFTNFETTDPSLYPTTSSQYTQCGDKYRAQRAGLSCREIQFIAADALNGPMHTNDNILTCNGTTLGRAGKGDRLESVGVPGYVKICGATEPNVQGTFQAGVGNLPIPTNNDKVSTVAVAPYILTGTNTLVLDDTRILVKPLGQSSYYVNMPANGVIYVKAGAGGCGAGVRQAVQDYSDPADCPNVYVSGRYARSLTIVSDKDIIVNGNIARASSNDLLGLIATKFVRVYHPVVRDGSGTCTGADAAGTMQDVSIDAAILSLKDSFIVDNYNCGGDLGTLSVSGAIAQVYRGPVGQSGGSTTGYTKSYNYDDRMKYRNPPYFLDPVSASWRVLRLTEQVPAR